MHPFKHEVVIYHGNCLDGFGAAYAAQKVLADGATYLPMDYDSPFRNDIDALSRTLDTAKLSDTRIYILDFSFPKAAFDKLLDQAAHVVLLDHHKSAFEDLAGEYRPGMSCVSPKGGNYDIWLDDTKSGAVLAWEWFLGTPLPHAYRLIDDRDRFVLKMHDSHAFHAGCFLARPWTFASFEDMITYPEKYVKQGEAVIRYESNLANDLLARAVRECDIATPDGSVVKGLAVNCNKHMHTTMGNLLASQCGTFGLCWYTGSDGMTHCGIRSIGMDVQKIAKAFGGGGHERASGFRVPMKILQSWIRQ